MHRTCLHPCPPEQHHETILHDLDCPVVACPAALCRGGRKPAKRISLFDGKTLDGWDGDPRFWSVKDGVICGQTTRDNPTEHNTFLIWRKGEVSDFQLDLDFRLVGGNSGIQYRSQEADKWVIGGYQADFDAAGTYSGILYEERGRGILTERGKKIVVDEQGKVEVVGQRDRERRHPQGDQERGLESLHRSSRRATT